MKKTPVRTCIVCRSKDGKRDLLRIVRDKQKQVVFFDSTGKANGRGAYVCNDSKCINALSNQKLVSSAFNMQISKDNLKDLIEEINSFNKEV